MEEYSVSTLVFLTVSPMHLISTVHAFQFTALTRVLPIVPSFGLSCQANCLRHTMPTPLGCPSPVQTALSPFRCPLLALLTTQLSSLPLLQTLPFLISWNAFALMHNYGMIFCGVPEGNWSFQNVDSILCTTTSNITLRLHQICFPVSVTLPEISSSLIPQRNQSESPQRTSSLPARIWATTSPRVDHTPPS